MSHPSQAWPVPLTPPKAESSCPPRGTAGATRGGSETSRGCGPLPPTPGGALPFWGPVPYRRSPGGGGGTAPPTTCRHCGRGAAIWEAGCAPSPVSEPAGARTLDPRLLPRGTHQTGCPTQAAGGDKDDSVITLTAELRCSSQNPAAAEATAPGTGEHSGTWPSRPRAPGVPRLGVARADRPGTGQPLCMRLGFQQKAVLC